MSSPSSLPSFSPFSLLPFELVQQIIESSVPYNFHSTTYRNRQNTLLSLCLVSRLFHQISKPLLFAVARIDEKNRDLWLLSQDEEEENSRSRSRTLELIIDHPNTLIIDITPILPVQAHLTRLAVDLTSAIIDLVVLSDLKHLKNLRLVKVDIKASGPFTFPHLSVLALCDINLSDSFVSDLGPRSFPLLRHYTAIGLYQSVSISSFQDQLLHAVSEQLEAAAFDLYTVRIVRRDSWIRIKHKALVDVLLHELNDCSQLPYLRIQHYGDVEISVDFLVRQIPKLPSNASPTVLYLPPQYAPNAQPKLLHQQGMQDFLDDCAARQIEVNFEEQTSDYEIDSEISPDFRKRMREKEEEQA